MFFVCIKIKGIVIADSLKEIKITQMMLIVTEFK